MAIGIAEIAKNNGGTGATLVSTVPAAGTPAGATIVVVVCERANAAPGGTITDTAGNTYTAVASASIDNTQANGFGRVFYAINTAALVSGNVITYTRAISGSPCAMECMQLTGVDAAVSIDAAATATTTGNSATPSVTSGIPGSGNDIFIGFVCGQGSLGAFTQDSTNGAWATPPVASSSGTADGSAKLNGGSLVASGLAAKTYAPTFAVAKAWMAGIVAFKSAGASMPTTSLMGV